MFEPNEDDLDMIFVNKQTLENQIAVALGGRIAEELIFGDKNITTGASGDINHVQSIARHMVTHYGLSTLGAIAWHSQEYSQNTMSKIDEEVKHIVTQIYASTKTLLKNNINDLHAIAKGLLDKETLSGDDIKKIFVK